MILVQSTEKLTLQHNPENYLQLLFKYTAEWTQMTTIFTESTFIHLFFFSEAV